MFLILLSCASLTCGPGTFEDKGQCQAISPLDTAPPADDSGAEPDDTAPVDEDSADTASDSGDDTGEDPVEPVARAVYILAGQSNMDGYGWYPGLPPAARVADPRVPLYWSGWGAFRPLQAASYGGGPYVGPEVTFGRALADAGQSVALVKHAVGGTDLAEYWYPGAAPADGTAGPGFATLIDTMEAAALELDASGEPWFWAGFIWMQGESDSLDLSKSEAYEENLRGLIDAVRFQAGDPALPAVIGLIARESIWTYADTVRAAQQAVADADPTVVTVETDDLPRNLLDVAHYDGISNRLLGARFAAAAMAGRDLAPSDDRPQAAFSVTAGATDYDFVGTCGWELSLEAPITVTDIGAYGAGYLYSSAEVGIWDADGALVHRVTVPSWLSAPAVWRGNIWYVAVDPFTLAPGTYRLGLVSWSGDGDRYLNNATGTFGPGIVYSQAVYAEGYYLTYPSASFASSTMNFLGPSFLYLPADGG